MNFREDCWSEGGGTSPKCAEEPVAVAAAPPRPRILVAEDDNACRAMVTLVLSRFGYQVDAVEDGERAWQSLGNGAYRLLITDHNMPKLSGLELVGKMRTAGMGLAVISISGTLTEDDVDAYRGLGVEALLPKPFLPRELVELVDATLFGLRRRV